MFRGGRGSRGGYRGGGGSGRRGRGYGQQATQQRGLFADGIWHCDCEPRLPAEHFRVKKEGKNQGRWFYTCQQHEQQRCGFFLWDEDAKPREEAAVLSNSRTEPQGESVQTGWHAGREPTEPVTGKGLFGGNQRIKAEDDESTDSPSPDSSSETLRAAPSKSKRTAQDAMLDEEDWGFKQSDDEAIATAVGKAAMQTPLKAQKTGVYATPATTTTKRKLPWLEQPATPSESTHHPESYFDTPSKQQATTSALGDPRTPSVAAPVPAAATPSPPTRHRDAFVNPADSTSALTTEVLNTLSGVHVPPDTLLTLRSILSKHDLRAQGVVKGRDISRLALKAKDAKIAELQARIASLEAHWEVERELGKMKRRNAGGGGGGG